MQISQLIECIIGKRRGPAEISPDKGKVHLPELLVS